jgi:hypothetical protein
MTILSGCKALINCTIKDDCIRYRRFVNSPYKGFNAHQTCRLSHFTGKRYLHFIPIEESFLLKNQDYGR